MKHKKITKVKETDVLITSLWDYIRNACEGGSLCCLVVKTSVGVQKGQIDEVVTSVEL